MMHGHEKSDPAIVAVKPANKAEPPAAEQSAAKPTAAEPVEPRARTKGNADQQSTCRTQCRASVSQALERIRKVARERKKEKFISLFHHISVELLEAAFYELKTDAAAGVDRLTWKDYEADFDDKTSTCTTGSIGEHIRHCRAGGSTSRRQMVGSARLRLPP